MKLAETHDATEVETPQPYLEAYHTPSEVTGCF